MARRTPVFTEEELIKFSEYTTMTDSGEFNFKRAKIMGIEAKGVGVAMGASVRCPLEQIGENVYIGLYSFAKYSAELE